MQNQFESDRGKLSDRLDPLQCAGIDPAICADDEIRDARQVSDVRLPSVHGKFGGAPLVTNERLPPRGRDHNRIGKHPYRERRDMKKSTPISALVGALMCMIYLIGYPVTGEARSTTGFNAFRVQNPTDASTAGFPNGTFDASFYGCLTEDNGAVVNNCRSAAGNSITVNLVFDLPIDSEGTHNITVLNYWQQPPSGSSYVPFRCQAYSYRGMSGNADATSAFIQFTAAGQTTNNTMSVNVGHPVMGMTVICWYIPAGEGIAIVNWDP